MFPEARTGRIVSEEAASLAWDIHDTTEGRGSIIAFQAVGWRFPPVFDHIGLIFEAH
jgi:hypothetical protein